MSDPMISGRHVESIVSVSRTLVFLIIMSELGARYGRMDNYMVQLQHGKRRSGWGAEMRKGIDRCTMIVCFVGRGYLFPRY